MLQTKTAVAEPDATELETRDEVFARIVREHARFLFRVAHGLLRHPQDAEDAVQDALLKLYRGESWSDLREAGAIRAIRDERAFLARVVWRAALDRMQSRVVAAAIDDVAVLVMDGRAGPEAAAAEGDERGLLHELIDALPLDLREPLLLSAIEELSSREVGLVMGLPEGTVRTRLMRARSKLREAFEMRRVKARRAS